MKRSLIAAALVLPLAFTGTAFADGLDNCTAEPESAWKPIEAITKMATDEGYEVSKAKKEGTCYEVYAKDKDGKLWELFYNPVDGKIMEKEAKS